MVDETMNNQLKQLEERALKAEEKIAKLEDSLARQGYAANGGDVSALRKRYVEELMQLRGTLVHAEEEHAALENKVIMLEEDKAKLEYQIKHLKRSVLKTG